jgi:hypothetical protein
MMNLWKLGCKDGNYTEVTQDDRRWYLLGLTLVVLSKELSGVYIHVVPRLKTSVKERKA